MEDLILNVKVNLVHSVTFVGLTNDHRGQEKDNKGLQVG